RFESFHEIKRLLQNRHAVDSRDNYRSRQAHGITQTFHRAGRFALKDHTAADWFHPDDTNFLLHEFRQDKVAKTPKMSVHHVQGHLHRVEREVMFLGGLQHAEMNDRIFVPREPGEPDFARFVRGLESFDYAVLGEAAIGVFKTND